MGGLAAPAYLDGVIQMGLLLIAEEFTYVGDPSCHTTANHWGPPSSAERGRGGEEGSYCYTPLLRDCYCSPVTGREPLRGRRKGFEQALLDYL